MIARSQEQAHRNTSMRNKHMNINNYLNHKQEGSTMNDSILSATPHEKHINDTTPPTKEICTIDVVNQPLENSAATRIKYKQYLKAEGEVKKKKNACHNFESERDKILKSYKLR